jgi:tRNA G26 N,N-dimethylase Trm1
MTTIYDRRPSALMYTHREEKNRVDVVDLDPYGTAAPFIDAAIQCIKDGGERGITYIHLLCSFPPSASFIRTVVCHLHRPFCFGHH